MSHVKLLLAQKTFSISLRWGGISKEMPFWNYLFGLKHGSQTSLLDVHSWLPIHIALNYADKIVTDKKSETK